MGRTTAKQINIAERRQKALSMRKSGATYDMIAKAIAQDYKNQKYSRQHAWADVDAELKEISELRTHDTEVIRQQELERLDNYLLQLDNKIKLEDTSAINTALKVAERRAKLLGLDAPVQIQVEEIVDGELRQFLEKLEGRLPSAEYDRILDILADDREKAAVAGLN